MANRVILELFGQTPRLTLGPLIRGAGVPVPCYPDIRGILSSPKNLTIIANECARFVEEWGDVDCIAGCAMGGIAIATALSLTTRKPLLLLRKTPRPYGINSAIDGTYKKGQRVLLVDDSIVTGTSKHPFVYHLIAVKLRPTRFLVIMDVGGASPLWRKQRQWFDARHVEIHSLVTWTEWALYMRDRRRIPRRTVGTILNLMEHPPKWVEEDESITEAHPEDG